MDFIVLAYFQQSDKILCKISVCFTGCENVVSMIELDKSSLACTDTQHRNRQSEQSHSTR